MLIYKFLIGVIFHYLINKFFLYKKILVDDHSFLKHKAFLGHKKQNILTGGVVFICLFLFYLQISFIYKILISAIFFIGVLSDIKLLNKPSLRFFIQTLTISLIVYNLGLGINYTDLSYLDFFIQNYYVGIFFSIFCILILINGSNFLDGLNTLIIGYYLLVLITILFLIRQNSINYDIFNVTNLIVILTINFIFNLFNKNFLGDSGAYSISCVIGVLTIDFYKSVNDFSVLFIVLLLWYPAFETLFSIIRKTVSKIGPSEPDNGHLHQLLFRYISIKKNRYVSNLLAANIINLYNGIVFYISFLNYKNSIFLLILLIFNLFIYILVYLILKKIKFS